jgi:hypothetical protein
MSTRFRAHDTFCIHSRRMFVITGEILEGTVRVGMQVEMPLNDAVSMTAPITAVEFVDGPGRQSRIGLGIRYEDEVELATWQGLNIGGGVVLTVSESDGDAPAPDAVPPRKPWWKPW